MKMNAYPIRNRLMVGLFVFCSTLQSLVGAQLDVAPFGIPLPDACGVKWEDPRELHEVEVQFKETVPAPETVHLEYWGSWWPEQHLPKDREPGGGDIGWMELGNWYKYGWRTADTICETQGHSLKFRFRPVNEKEFPKIEDYPAPFRYTLKMRICSEAPLPPVDRLKAYTDSTMEPMVVRVLYEETPLKMPSVEVFNGSLESVEKTASRELMLNLQVSVNSDPNTFDKTLVTLRTDDNVFTFKVDDLKDGPLILTHLGIAVVRDNDTRDYTELRKEQKGREGATLYERVKQLPEQTWKSAWDSMPPKKSHIYFPLGLDGGRQRFRLHANGDIDFRSNDHYLKNLKGNDTDRLDLEPPPVEIKFGLPDVPVDRSLEGNGLPVCRTVWNQNGVQVEQTAFVTELNGLKSEGPAPDADAFTVFMARFAFTNTSTSAQSVSWHIEYHSGGDAKTLRLDDSGMLWIGDQLRGQVEGLQSMWANIKDTQWTFKLKPGEDVITLVKIPYCILTESSEWDSLKSLNYDVQHTAVAEYWRRQFEKGARLITPEPMLNAFYRSHAMHLLVNCEREPGSDRRFARVGSFSYGAYGNESCMMVLDLERRGYHKLAQDCLDAWLHYQGTVPLPGSFSGHDGVLYGAAGYEAGGYNQHHGWILWMLAEHYRFTRDKAWLEQAAPGIIKGADWIIRETARTSDRSELEQGLLPAGSLEDIGDWWTWLSTSCYTWRGLDNAAWALEEIQHPEADRIRQAADDYHAALLKNFREAAARSPVVRLRDGTAVPKFPSHVHRRGRSFGWICETLEGAIHLLITRALDPNSQEAEWILKDYEDNLYLSNQYGYTLDDFDTEWFSHGGMSMQACLLLGVEPYLYRDDVKHALRALFNGQAVSYFPDVCLNTEHALPELGDWRGDHFKSSDESNAAGWLRYLFVREDNEYLLLIGQAIPREWLAADKHCGIENAATWFGTVSVMYHGTKDQIICDLKGPQRNPPREIRVRFRDPESRSLQSVIVNGKPWTQFKDDWVTLPGSVGNAKISANFN